MKFRVTLLILVLPFLTAPFACQRIYSVPPLTLPAATSTATPPCTSNWGLGVTTCSSGINWGESLIWNYDVNGTYQYGVSLALAVNCAPETTDGVTLTGPGVSLPLSYSGPVTLNGTVYADYQSVTVTGALTSGDLYTLTSVTSIGTATSSVPLPEPITITNTSGVTYAITWNGGAACGINLFNFNPGGICWVTGAGLEVASSPMIWFNWSNSFCNPGSLVGAQFYGANFNINGGSGILNITNGDIVPFL